MARVRPGPQDSSAARLRQQAHADAELRGRGRHRSAGGRRLDRPGDLGDDGSDLVFQLHRQAGSRFRPASRRGSSGRRVRGGAQRLRYADGVGLGELETAGPLKSAPGRTRARGTAKRPARPRSGCGSPRVRVIPGVRPEVRPGGLEPPAFGSEVRRSVQLSYGRRVGPRSYRRGETGTRSEGP